MNIPLDWIGVVLNVWGVYLNAKKNIWCWFLWIIGNGVWIVYWWPKREWAVITITVIYLGMNFYGYREWKKDRRP